MSSELPEIHIPFGLEEHIQKCIDTFETKGQDTSNLSRNTFRRLRLKGSSVMQEEELLGREDFHRERFSLDPDILDNHRQGPIKLWKRMLL